MYVLGINYIYHELAVCLLKNGEVVSFVEEERFNRIKHGKKVNYYNTNELPLKSISYCLEEEGIGLEDIEYIALSYQPWLSLKAFFKNPFMDFGVDFEDGYGGNLKDIGTFFLQSFRIKKQLKKIFGAKKINKCISVSHHASHAASAFFVSPYNEAAVLTVDGEGESSSTTLSYGSGNSLKLLSQVFSPHSIGLFWESVSLFLGFSRYDSAKVMGMAAYGDKARFRKEFSNIIESTKGGFEIKIRGVLSYHSRPLEDIFKIKKRNKNEKILQVHYDIAAALQEVTEKILIDLANHIYTITKSKNLCLAGGVALNCVANWKIQENTPFESIYVQPAANDAGTALGAAYYVWNKVLGNEKKFVMDSPYTGPSYSNEEIKKVLDKNHMKYEFFENIEYETAKLIAEEKVVSWFQGRMEVGPRALGNRSFVCDPRSKNMRNILNAKVKHREEYRPFAPAVLDEEKHSWFQVPDNCHSNSSDFMLFTYPVQPDKAVQIPAVVHQDGTCRLQTVRKNINPRFHLLITEFYKRTGVPVVLNTSFNDQEPIVCTPEDALNTFRKTRIDCLVMGNYLLRRESNK